MYLNEGVDLGAVELDEELTLLRILACQLVLRTHIHTQCMWIRIRTHKHTHQEAPPEDEGQFRALLIHWVSAGDTQKILKKTTTTILLLYIAPPLSLPPSLLPLTMTSCTISKASSQSSSEESSDIDMRKFTFETAVPCTTFTRATHAS